MRLITVKVPEVYVKGIDDLVKSGRYSNRSEAIRAAIRELLKRELWTSIYYNARAETLSRTDVGFFKLPDEIDVEV
ncbi:MAG: ribbon-helix-helix domain-containing protein [Acidilobaceae archaeon]